MRRGLSQIIYLYLLVFLKISAGIRQVETQPFELDVL